MNLLNHSIYNTDSVDFKTLYKKISVSLISFTMLFIPAYFLFSYISAAGDLPFSHLTIPLTSFIIIMILFNKFLRPILDNYSALEFRELIQQLNRHVPDITGNGSTLDPKEGWVLLGLPAIALAGLKELWTLHQAGLGTWVVDPGVWPPHCQHLGILCDLGLDALSRTLLDLAVRCLSISSRDLAADTRN